MGADSPVSHTGDGVTVAIRVTPKAGRNRIEGIVADASGRLAVRVAVTAAPADGKANKAVITLLARTWNVPKSTVSIQSGQTGRNKILRITGDTATLEKRIEETVRTPHNA